MAPFLEWGRGGLRMGLFFIVELCLVLFGESDLNPVAHFLKLGEGRRVLHR